MGVRKQKLTRQTKWQEQEALLAKLESALAQAVEQASHTMRETKVEIERSQELLDSIAHVPANWRTDGMPDQ